MAAAVEEGPGLLYPVDMKGTNPEVIAGTAMEYYGKLLEESSFAPELFSVPGREKVQLEASLMHFLPLYREDSKCKILVLTDPQDKTSVLALHLHNSWWLTEDVLKTTDPFREGLRQVETFAERIVLFVLNCIIFGMLERSLACDALFVPHPKKERAKIFWTRGEAVAFYTIKGKGSLCDGLTSQCYLLPVLDTMFVRRKFRRRGLGMKMLHDFCQTFAAEEALGLSCPVSADMYRVCQKFLEIHPEEQPRLWEVEAPGDWSQRVSIWLKIQLEQNLPREVPLGKLQDGKLGQSNEAQKNERDGRFPKSMASLEPNSVAEEFKCEPEDAFDLQAHEHVVQMPQNKGSKKRAREPPLDCDPKHFRPLP
ncbi:protein FAM169B [Anolis carolinensis]|uniref:protein FAM169B n=1 Tax=Anolis carolinensis TaxID=28377 RepID=UPI00046255FC|nr:PREDICTED: protein FAM169B [Anolis carolinensis]|eukprot:XP_008117244.1 PREDICTED: protein FAM169B [Anolis carolinensis]